jgi:hypothetical protein
MFSFGFDDLKFQGVLSDISDLNKQSLLIVFDVEEK